MQKIEKPEQNSFNFRDKKHLFLTYAQCPVEREELLEFFKEKLQENLFHWIISKEKHQDGNNHLHAYIELKKPIRSTDSKLLDFVGYHPNIGKVRNFKAVVRYLQKEDHFPLTNYQDLNHLLDSKTDKDKKDLQLIVQEKLSLQEYILENPEKIVNYERLFRSVSLFRLHNLHPLGVKHVRGIWIYGPPGTGKSHLARAIGSNKATLFIKPQNKWFDGYNGEENILLDDLDHFGGQCLAHYLKIWMDKYPCTGEIKGSTVPLLHKHFIVTSNYSIDELWPDKTDREGNVTLSQHELRTAIARRCLIHKLDTLKDAQDALEEGIEMLNADEE